MRTVVLLAMLSLIPACTSAPPQMTDAERAQIEAEINDQSVAFREALVVGDPQAFASFWTSDAVILEPGLNVTLSDSAAFFEEAFNTLTVTAIEWDVFDLFIHGDVAYMILAYDETIQVEGQDPYTANNYGFVRWEKEDGVWKFDRLVAGPRDAPPEG